VHGSILHLGEIASWRDRMRTLHEKGSGEAELSCAEPHLWAKASLGSLGNGTLEVRIRPDSPGEEHRLVCNIDQSYLPDVILALDRLLEQYPLRGKAPSA